MIPILTRITVRVLTLPIVLVGTALGVMWGALRFGFSVGCEL